MAVQPAPNPFYLFIILLKLFGVNHVQVLASLFFARFGLPWSREYQIYVVVQTPRFQGFPFIAIQPDAIAGTALFDVKPQPMPDPVSQHYSSAFRAELCV